MLKKGQSVKVKPGTLDYESEKYDISGWQGRVMDIDKNEDGSFIEVQWDSITLLAIPFEYIEESVEEDLEYENYILGEEDLIACEPRDTEADVHRAQAQINNDYFEMDDDDDAHLN
jgi:hypothetical protein